MKKLFLTLSLMFALNMANAQTAPDYTKYPLDTPEHVKKADEGAKLTAEYLLATPVNKDPQKRLEALQFLFGWMEASEDYSFNIDSTISLMGEDQQLIAVYLAAIVKHQVNGKIKQGNDAVTLAALKTVADYIAEPKNGVVATADQKRLIEANKKGELKKFVNDYKNE